MTPLEFLNELWQAKPEDQHILIWTYPDKRSRWFTAIPEAADYVASINGNRDAYVGVGLSAQDHGPARRCVSDEITCIAGIACDLDLHSEAHGKKALPNTIDEALKILPPALPPTLVVATGNGAHCWWLLKEPYVFDDDEDRKEVSRIVTRWHTMLQLNAASHGWAYERLSDLARVLRIPGTRNVKDPAHPKDVSAAVGDGPQVQSVRLRGIAR
jgi:putative DNA primase/helicase